jgi:hypothetical protein
VPVGARGCRGTDEPSPIDALRPTIGGRQTSEGDILIEAGCERGRGGEGERVEANGGEERERKGGGEKLSVHVVW